jgi:hypothetical protein
MTVRKLKPGAVRLEALVAQDRDLLKALAKEALEQVMQGEMADLLGAAVGERTEQCRGYWAGYYSRALITRVGKIELRVPRDRNGEFLTALFVRFQCSEKALVAALAQMYVQGVSTRKVKAITEELCGHSFSASAISEINKGLDATLTKFAHRRLTEDYPYLILDARYEKVRDDGVIQSQAVLIAIGINWDPTSNPRRAHLPECQQLLAPGAGVVRRDARDLARGQPLSQHGFAPRRAQGAAQESSLDLRPDRPICTTSRTQPPEGGRRARQLCGLGFCRGWSVTGRRGA